MMDEAFAWLSANEGPWAYLVLALASLVEYVFPPLPGDSLAFLGIVLALHAGYSATLVYAALNVGALVGGLVAYAFGLTLAERERRPRWLRGRASEAALERLVTHFRARGALYLAANRFVPALRAFFFVAAGVARVSLLEVVLYGGASALAWNAMLFGVAWALDASFDSLSAWFETYALAFAAVAAVGGLAWLARLLWERRRRDEPRGGGEP